MYTNTHKQVLILLSIFATEAAVFTSEIIFNLQTANELPNPSCKALLLRIMTYTYMFIDLAAKLAGLWCTIYIKNVANIKKKRSL